MIYTTSGIYFDLLHPHPDDVRLSDIGTALQNLSRFTGHARHGKPWTVARHSLVVARIVSDLAGTDDRKLLRTAVFHDATEAYTGDCSSPMKDALRKISTSYSAYDRIERGVWEAIATKFDLYVDMPDVVKHADKAALGIEADRIFGQGTSKIWGLPQHAISFVPTGGFTKTAQFLLD